MRWITKVGLICLLLLQPNTTATAQGSGEDQNEGRYIIVDADCIVYTWQLMGWQDLKPACSFWLYNEGPPTASEVRAFCGAELSAAWYQTAQVSSQGQAPNSGYYVLLDKLAYTTCKTGTELPQVKFSYSISGNKLNITATEPINEHQILNISGNVGAHPFECLGSSCQILIAPTGPRGIEIKFQALSTISDDPTPANIIYIRYLSPAIPEMVDQHNGTAAQQIWGSFPEPGQHIDWLRPQARASQVGYSYLAGRMIAAGLVDCSSCYNSGLLWINGYASMCGLATAWPEVVNYQNRLDWEINQVAAEVGIPGQLLKNLIGIESQFWDDQHINWGAAGEAGLGQLTHNGADTLLLWDLELYQAVCLPWFGPECSFSYSRLDDWQRSVLQNEIMTEPGLEILARALLANAAQAGQIIRDQTGSRPGEFLDHQDLWRAALVNYNAGPGCLKAGLRDMIKAGYNPSWGSLAASLGAVCPAAPGYVELVTATPLPYRPTESQTQ